MFQYLNEAPENVDYVRLSVIIRHTRLSIDWSYANRGKIPSWLWGDKFVHLCPRFAQSDPEKVLDVPRILI